MTIDIEYLFKRVPNRPFKTIDEVRDWALNEAVFWNRFAFDGTSETLAQKAYSIKSHLDEIATSITERAILPPASIRQNTQRIIEFISNYYYKFGYNANDSKFGEEVINTVKSNPYYIEGYLDHLNNLESDIPYPMVMDYKAGKAAATLARLSVIRPDVDPREILSKQVREFDTKIKRVENSGRKIIDEIKNAGDECISGVNAASEESKTRIRELESLLAERMQLDEAVMYWKRRAYWRFRVASGFLGLFTILVATSIGLIFGYGASFLQFLFGPASGVDGLTARTLPATGIFLLATLLGIWALRQILRLTISNFHLAEDASEREKMILTYLALRETGALPEDKTAIMQAIFRNAQTGWVTDDSGPNTPVEVIMRGMSGTTRSSGSGQ